MLTPDIEQEKIIIINRYRGLLRAWRPSKPEDNKDVRKAFNFAAEAHKDMRRRTGEPYIYHSIEVARIVAGEIGLGKTSIICALLHDVVEDTDFNLKDIENIFGKRVAKIIDGLTKIKDILDKSSTSIQAENFKKMLLTLSDDVRVILIKLADRLHNMRTLDAMPPHKQLKIASETTYLYAPLAHRFGLYSIKTELEDLALKYTEPGIFSSISEKLLASEKERKRVAIRFIYPIKKSLLEKGFDFEIIMRNKSVNSIWKKMKSKAITYEEVFDLTAIRIIINTPFENEKVDCWRVYSIITDHYRPNIDRLRDWISIPKANGYEALHTTVMSNEGQWVEVQIRTTRMDDIAEKGYASHWRYKDGTPTTSESNLNNWLLRIRDMLQNNDSDALDFIDEFRGFLFSDEIYVFTPQGELRNLPLNSTVLDFAYAIHSDIGNTCIGAKVNHKLSPLNLKLKSGDQVEILTSKKQIPKEEWFGYVVTARAKTKLKQGIKEEKKKYADKGLELLERYFEELKIKIDDNKIKILCQKYNYASRLDLYYDLAKELIGLKEIRDCCAANDKESWITKMIKFPFGRSKSSSSRKTLTETVIEQLNEGNGNNNKELDFQKISYDISSCCLPIPGDDIVGFIEPHEAIKIHRINCPVAENRMSKYGNKIINTTWSDKESIGFLTGIEIHGIDKPGLIMGVVKIIADDLKINIKSFHLDSDGGMLQATIMLFVYNIQNLNELMKRLKAIPELKKVVRTISHNSV